MLKGWFLAASLALTACASAAEDAVTIPAPAVDQAPASAGLRKAVVAGGCFWGVQGVYQHLRGVRRVLSGYAGGAKSTADYDAVSGGDTGHAESVEILYDPAQVTYGQILQVFFSVVHDPTQLNRQGPDVGTQYRSAVFYRSAAQRKATERYIAKMRDAKLHQGGIVTEIAALRAFHPAESYHQNYLVRHPNQPYIVVNDAPKLEHLKREFPELYRKQEVS